MTDWKDVGQVLLGSWPSQVAGWGREAIAAYVAELKDRGLSPAQAVVALRSSECAFPPSAGEVVGSVRVDPRAPTFDEAYPVIYRAASRQQLPEAHRLIVNFIELQGLQRLGRLPLDDPEWGEKHRRDLGDAWDRHVEAADGREVLRIASGDRSVLKRLDPGSFAGVLAEGKDTP